MTSREFVFWLQGYLYTPGFANVAEIIEVMKEIDDPKNAGISQKYIGKEFSQIVPDQYERIKLHNEKMGFK